MGRCRTRSGPITTCRTRSCRSGIVQPLSRRQREAVCVRTTRRSDSWSRLPLDADVEPDDVEQVLSLEEKLTPALVHQLGRYSAASRPERRLVRRAARHSGPPAPPASSPHECRSAMMSCASWYLRERNRRCPVCTSLVPVPIPDALVNDPASRAPRISVIGDTLADRARVDDNALSLNTRLFRRPIVADYVAFRISRRDDCASPSHPHSLRGRDAPARGRLRQADDLGVPGSRLRCLADAMDR